MRASTCRSASSRARRSASACALLASVARASASWTWASASWTAASAAALVGAGRGCRPARQPLDLRAGLGELDGLRRSARGSGAAASSSSGFGASSARTRSSVSARAASTASACRASASSRAASSCSRSQSAAAERPWSSASASRWSISEGSISSSSAAARAVLSSSRFPSRSSASRGPQLGLLGAALGLARAALGLGQAPLDGLELSRRLLLRPLQVLLEREDLVQRPVLGLLGGGLGGEPDPLRDVAVGARGRWRRRPPLRWRRTSRPRSRARRLRPRTRPSSLRLLRRPRCPPRARSVGGLVGLLDRGLVAPRSQPRWTLPLRKIVDDAVAIRRGNSTEDLLGDSPVRRVAAFVPRPSPNRGIRVWIGERSRARIERR